MKKLLLLPILTLIFITSVQAQKKVQWEAFVDGRLVSRSQVPEGELKVSINASEVSSDASFGVRVYTLQPCLSCYQVLVIKNKEGEVYTEAETNQKEGEMSVPFADLFGYWAQQSEGHFQVYSYLRTPSGQKMKEEFLFDLHFE
ncbi:hypothetical protein KFE98_19915 [bacterium SCSIO 12741]|nr:hypothetical protein KFE98_19915 [bacterium SCSIO 12741]